jgi:hypothetical protein
MALSDRLSGSVLMPTRRALVVVFHFRRVSVTVEAAVRHLEGVWGGVCANRDVDCAIGSFRDAIALEIRAQDL